MLPYRESKFAKIALIIFFVLVIGYGFFEGRGVILGPTIAVENRVMNVDQPFIEIEGTANRIASLSMNGQTISVTENGVFSEPYLLASGYNRIVITAKDRYNKTAERVIEIIYTPPPAEMEQATSTPSASALEE